MEVIAFPDAEALAISYLKTKVTNTVISTKIPDPRPARFVKVTRVGGSKIRLNAESAMLVFECWEADTIKAFDLCRLVRAYIHAIEGDEVNGQWVYKVEEVGGPAFYPDQATKSPRYQFTVNIHLKGEAL